LPDVRLSETAPLVEAASGTPTSRRFRARLIEGGIQGSSGFYPVETLRRDGPTAFPAGTHVYCDHPSMTEASDRPERSVKDLAGRLTTDATYERDGLYADIEVFPHYAPLIEGVADAIGMSIRAAGIAEPSHDESIRGPIITALTEGISVDFVTRAGAGGKVMALLESARNHSAGDADVSEAKYSAEQLRQMLAKGQAIKNDQGEPSYPIADEEDLRRAIRAVGRGGSSHNKIRAYIVRRAKALGKSDMIPDHWSTSGSLTSASETEPPPTDPAVEAEHKSPAPPAQPMKEEALMTESTTVQGAPPSGGAQTTEVSESALRTELAETKAKLAEAELTIAKHGENERELAETKTQLDEARKENLRLRANDAARTKATATLAESTLPKVAHARVIEAVTGDNVPLNDEGSLDEAALVKNIRTAIEDQRSYLTAFAEEAGVGQVRGLGGGDEPQVNVEGELAEVFQTIGMSESAATTAAKGRG
jgi:hypothetical protein